MSRLDPQALSLSAALLAAAVALPCPAQAQQKKIVPASAANGGGSSSIFPYSYDVHRVQQILNAPDVTQSLAVLKSINFRRDNSNAAYTSIKLAKHTFSLGHTSVSPANMSTTFTANITSTMTTLVNNTAFTLPAQPVPTKPPAPFNIKYPASTPYLYNPKNGHLLMEWITGSGAAQNRNNYSLDAVRLSKTGGGGATAFGNWGKFAGGDTPTWKANASKLIPGGAVDIGLAGFKQGYRASMFFGVSNKTYNGLPLPYDLGNIGAPGNWLYTGLDLILPFKLNETSPGSGIFWASVNIPLPNNNKLIGAKGYAQTYYADAKANAAGLVSSDALALSIGSTSPATQAIAVSNTTAAKGRFLFPGSSITNPGGIGGMVVQLEGAIQ